MSPISESRKRANENYLQKLEEIKVRVPKGKKAIIESHAEAHSESVNKFINRAIDVAMERDNAAPGAADGLADAKGGGRE